jgi:uncharacterized 2Fe-2S/4Fe-4S cluster protein (DUF4445 family)
MVCVTFHPSLQSVRVAPGTTILEASRKAGVLIEAPCNGAGHCGKCLVRLSTQDLAAVVVHMEAAPLDGNSGNVLACHGEVYGDITVEVPRQREEGLRVQSAGVMVETTSEPYIRRCYDEDSCATVVWGGGHQLGREQGDTSRENYGLVVDIGTTTLVAALVDLSSGRELASVSALNPQSLHAQDVLSRIRFAADTGGLATLQHALVTELNRLVSCLHLDTGFPPERIYEAVLSGNTCMLHLLAGVDPAPLGKHPFIPTVTGGCHLNAADICLGIAPNALVYLPPVISAYVGADISSGILAGNVASLAGVTLFIDIGTNGELVLASDGRLVASATAAGPAFEGMNISCGMRAAVGAIERIDISPGGAVDIGVIGGGDPTGICGSGLMDLVAELVEGGLIGRSGRLAAPAPGAANHRLSDRITKSDVGTMFRVHGNVVLSQKDIRQVQLAKGAIRAGIELLLQELGLSVTDLDRVFIAGSFGFHLRERSLITLGLLPGEAAGKVAFLGNTSRSGGEMLLVNHLLREQLQDTVTRVETVDLAGNPSFERMFMEAMAF